MIPEKIGSAHSPAETSQPSREINRTHSLSISEGGKVVGKFVYDRLSSAVSLIHELKVLATIKFRQLEIIDEPVVSDIDRSYQNTVSEDKIKSGQLSSLNQICKILSQHLENSRQAQMPCALILMGASLEKKSSDIHDDTIILELTSIVGEIKGPQCQLLWYPFQTDFLVNDGHNRQKACFLSTGFCLILPATGLIKARLFIDEIKKHLNGPDWQYCPITLSAGVGVKTTTDITADGLIEKVIDNLQKSVNQSGKLFCFTDTSSSSQVTVEERAQLFMISKKVVT